MTRFPGHSLFYNVFCGVLSYTLRCIVIFIPILYLCHIKLYNIVPLLMKSISPNFFYTAASFAVLGGLVSCQSRQKPLNIVYIMTDDHTSQMMSC